MQANKIKINKNKIETTLNLNRKCKTQIGATRLKVSIFSFWSRVDSILILYSSMIFCLKLFNVIWLQNIYRYTFSQYVQKWAKIQCNLDFRNVFSSTVLSTSSRPEVTRGHRSGGVKYCSRVVKSQSRENIASEWQQEVSPEACWYKAEDIDCTIRHRETISPFLNL